MPETRTQIHRHPERSVPEHAADILTQGYVAHVGFLDEGRPVVIPFGYHFDTGTPGGLGSGIQACHGMWCGPLDVAGYRRRIAPCGEVVGRIEARVNPSMLPQPV